jgi:competence protein ComEA
LSFSGAVSSEPTALTWKRHAARVYLGIPKGYFFNDDHQGNLIMRRLTAVLFITFCSFNVFASPVNINTADAKTIGESLSGIGLKKAEAIVKYRLEKGPFKTVEELDNVSGIGMKTVTKIKKDVLLSDASSALDPKIDSKTAEKTDKKAN